MPPTQYALCTTGSGLKSPSTTTLATDWHMTCTFHQTTKYLFTLFVFTWQFIGNLCRTPYQKIKTITLPLLKWWPQIIYTNQYHNAMFIVSSMGCKWLKTTCRQRQGFVYTQNAYHLKLTRIHVRSAQRSVHANQKAT